jgi:hypothetical protein
MTKYFTRFLGAFIWNGLAVLGGLAIVSIVQDYAKTHPWDKKD